MWNEVSLNEGMDFKLQRDLRGEHCGGGMFKERRLRVPCLHRAAGQACLIDPATTHRDKSLLPTPTNGVRSGGFMFSTTTFTCLLCCAMQAWHPAGAPLQPATGPRSQHGLHGLRPPKVAKQPGLPRWWVHWVLTEAQSHRETRQPGSFCRSTQADLALDEGANEPHSRRSTCRSRSQPTPRLSGSVRKTSQEHG